MTQSNPGRSEIDRRQFLHASGGVLAAATLSTASSPIFAHITGDDIIRVGLVGCGGRGTGAATNALTVEPRAQLVALGDLFQDQVDKSHRNLTDDETIASQVNVDEEHRFSGWDSYRKVIDSCDVVIFATTPHFRPMQIEAAVEAGKHIFAEKPVGVDAMHVERVRKACKTADEKGLTVVSGLCYRYQDAKQQTIERIRDGAIGDIVSLQCSYNTGGLWHRGRKDEWSEMEYEIRNWLYFTWLSGDHITEQSIHSLDKIMWAMGDKPPEKCTASGGRIVRTEDKWGNIFDHFNCTFEWADGIKLFHSCRQWPGADGNVSDYVFGSRGTAAIQGHRIEGENPWSFSGSPNDMYEAEWIELFKSVKGERPRINNGEYMCTSTLVSIMGRMSAYTGKTVSWNQLIDSKLDLSPKAYEWGDVSSQPVAQPGQTPLV